MKVIGDMHEVKTSRHRCRLYYIVIWVGQPDERYLPEVESMSS
jgi:hypothetical protein